MLNQTYQHKQRIGSTMQQ